MVYYHCRHCKSEIGKLPFTLAAETLSYIENMEETSESNQFMSQDMNGHLTIHAICEQCEQTLAENPHYHSLEKWLQ